MKPTTLLRWLNPILAVVYVALAIMWISRRNYGLGALYVALVVWFVLLWRWNKPSWHLRPKKPRSLKSPPLALLSNPHPSLTWPSQYEVQSTTPPPKKSRILSRPRVRRVASPVVGFRVWNTNLGFGPGLYALTGPRWNPGVNTAECHHGHSPAEPGCGCGYWIKDSYEGAETHRTAFHHETLGVAMGWGRVQRHLDGWRCEYAMPLALEFPSYALGTPIGGFLESEIKDIAMKFEVPILDGRKELMRWYLDNTEGT